METNLSIIYGLLVIKCLAQHKNDGFITLMVIAKEYNIPSDYFPRILEKLKAANIVISKKSHHGGYKLAKPSDEITLLEIIEAIDGPIHSTIGLENNAPNSQFAKKVEKVNERIIAQGRAEYGKVKLSDLI